MARFGLSGAEALLGSPAPPEVGLAREAVKLGKPIGESSLVGCLGQLLTVLLGRVLLRQAREWTETELDRNGAGPKQSWTETGHGT